MDARFQALAGCQRKYLRRNSTPASASAAPMPRYITPMKIGGATCDVRNKMPPPIMSGAEKFTAVFGDYLSQNLDLPDRRGDAAYARYDSSVAQYEAALAKLASVQEVAP